MTFAPFARLKPKQSNSRDTIGLPAQTLRSFGSLAPPMLGIIFASFALFLRLFLLALENQHRIPFGHLAQDPGCIPVC
jgi:hypothetical protein